MSGKVASNVKEIILLTSGEAISKENKQIVVADNSVFVKDIEKDEWNEIGTIDQEMTVAEFISFYNSKLKGANENGK